MRTGARAGQPTANGGEGSRGVGKAVMCARALYLLLRTCKARLAAVSDDSASMSDVLHPPLEAESPPPACTSGVCSSVHVAREQATSECHVSPRHAIQSGIQPSRRGSWCLEPPFIIFVVANFLFALSSWQKNKFRDFATNLARTKGFVAKMTAHSELEGECVKATPSAEKVRDVCREHGVSETLRPRVWQVLLGVTNRKANLETWWEEAADTEEDARQIRWATADPPGGLAKAAVSEATGAP